MSQMENRNLLKYIEETYFLVVIDWGVSTGYTIIWSFTVNISAMVGANLVIFLHLLC